MIKMSEAEWLATTSVHSMLSALSSEALGVRARWDRKLRLFAVACCKPLEPLLTDRRWRLAVEAAERFADAEISAEELKAAQEAAHTTVKKPRGISPGRLAVAVAGPSDSGAAWECALIARRLATRYAGDRD